MNDINFFCFHFFLPVEARTYLIRLNLMEKVGIYDYVPITFADDYKKMESRITHSGVCIGIVVISF